MDPTTISTPTSSAPASAAASHALRRFGLEGKKALVTGGTKGIGKAVVEELASLGASVFTCSRNEGELEEALRAWRARGLEVNGIAADVSTPEGRKELIEDYQRWNVVELYGGGAASTLDILVNNVGTNVKKPSKDYSKEDYDRVFGTNLESVIALTALAHPMLRRGSKEAKAERKWERKWEEEEERKKRGEEEEEEEEEEDIEEKDEEDDSDEEEGEGNQAPETSSVVIISSVAGGPPSMKSGSLYAATKAALDQLARNWACEWAQDGIRVTAVKPFYIDTPLASGVVGDPRQLRQVLDATPSRRVGSPEDVAGVVAFLCSRAAAHVTGETVAVDGGYLAAGFWPV
jgi:tropinone reductase I